MNQLYYDFDDIEIPAKAPRWKAAFIVMLVLFCAIGFMLPLVFGQTTAPTTAHFDADGNAVSVDVPPRRTPVKPPTTQPPPVNTPTITLSTGSLVFNQATKAPQSIIATGPAGIRIDVHDNLSFVDTGSPFGAGSLTATFTPNATYSTATQSINGSASFTAGSLSVSFPVSLKVGATNPVPPVTPPTQPPATNDPNLGKNSPAIAAINTVPYSSPATIGVVAWHINSAGIKSVTFTEDAKAPVVVTAMTLNAESKTVEYWTPVSRTAQNYTILVTPFIGLPVTLTCPLNQPAKINIVTGNQTAPATRPPGGVIWYRNAVLDGGGRGNNIDWGRYWLDASGHFQTDTYVTESVIQNCQDGFRYAKLLRNVVIHTIGSNFVTGSRTIINVDCYDMTQVPSDVHGDVWQGFGNLESPTILYGLTAGVNHQELPMHTRGINWSGDYSNIAVVNTTIRTDPGGMGFEVDQRVDNMLVKDSQFLGAGEFHGDTGNLNLTNVVLDHVIAILDYVKNPTGEGWWNQDPSTIPGITMRNGTSP